MNINQFNESVLFSVFSQYFTQFNNNHYVSRGEIGFLLVGVGLHYFNSHTPPKPTSIVSEHDYGHPIM